MQTLKEYIAIIIIAAIALFIEINFLHPEKYKSLLDEERWVELENDFKTILPDDEQKRHHSIL